MPTWYIELIFPYIMIYINIFEQGEPDLVRAAKACMAAVNRAQLADVSLKCVQLLK